MDFSIVVPAYNEEKRIKRCIDNLKNLDYPKKDYEIIVVDNASSDKTREIAISQNVKVLKEPRQGITFTRQKGLLAAKGRYFMTLDADTYVPSNYLKTAMKELKADPEIVGLSGPLLFQDTSPIYQKLLFWISLLMIWSTKSLFGNNMIIQTKTAKKVGGFLLDDTKFFEDIIISKRLREAGKIKISKKLYMPASFRRYNKGGLKTQIDIVLRYVIFNLTGKIYKDALVTVR